MITVLKGRAGDLHPVTEWAPGCWVDAVAPNADEIDQISRGLRVPRDWIVHALDVNERARIEREDGALFIVLRLPHVAGAKSEIQQAIEMTHISENILSQMMDAFASIISNNLNGVMKFLASMTILLSLPSLVASIYGMNIGLPLQQHPQAFMIVMGLSLTISIVVAIIFWRKDWF